MKYYLPIGATLAVALHLFLATAQSHAVVILTTDGNGEDGYVAEQASSGNGVWNQDHRLFNRTRSDSQARHEVTYLKFDLSSITGPITDANLELYQLASGNISLNLYGLIDNPSEIGGGADDWDGTAFTYNTAPGMNMSDGNTGTTEFDFAKLTMLGSYNITNENSVTKQLNSAEITAFLNADTNGVVTFILDNPTTGATQFRSSRETTPANPFTAGEHGPRLDITLPPPPAPEFEIDRDSGEIWIKNFSGTNLTNVIGYSLTSTSGTLDPTNWTSISDNYDADQLGPNQVDPDNNWIKLTDPASRTDLSETEFEGNGGANNGADFLDGTSTSLGNTWIQYHTEDVVGEVLLDNGDVVPLFVRFVGNNDVPFEFGDLDFDGDIDEDDFQNVMLPNYADDTSLLVSGAERYNLGDMNEDGSINLEDFFILNDAYLAANPGSGGLTFKQVPEPKAFWIVLAMSVLGLVFGGRRIALALARKTVTAPLGVLIATLIFASASQPEAKAVLLLTTDGNGADHYVSEQAGGGNNTPALDNRLFNRTRNDSLARHEVTYIRFDVSLLTAPLTDATLQLYQLGGGDVPLTIYGLNDDPSETSSPWDPTTITYNTAPGMNMSDGDTATTEFDLTKLTDLGVYNISGDINETKFLNSAALTSFINADTNGLVTLIFDNPTGGATVFRSSRTDAQAFLPGEHGPRIDLVGPGLNLELVVNRTTGQVTMKNDTPFDFDINGFRILSENDSLDSTNWNSLDSQAFDNDAWTELDAATNIMSEGAFGTSSVLGNGTEINLGNIYNPSVDAQDLVFEIHLASGTPTEYIAGTVSYFVGTAEDADFDDDGDVDGTDFLAWQAGFGITSGATMAQGDANADGAVNAADLSIWQGQYGSGNGGGSLAGAEVPEPSAILLLAFAALATAVAGRNLKK